MSTPSIHWISVAERVPDNRRWVLAWGKASIFMGLMENAESRFLGQTRFNPTDTGGRFDLDIPSRFRFCCVTHWAEIIGPDGADE